MLFGRRRRSIRRIMVVEDEPLVAFDNEYMLRDAGYEVVATVDRYAEAVAVIERERLDLILTDVRLRGERDGTDVARAAAERDVPVLFVTGFCPASAQGLAVGCLAKPYSDWVLKAALEALDDHIAGREVKRVPEQLTLYRAAA